MNPREEDSPSDASTYHIHALVPPTLEELNSLIPAYEFLDFVDRGGMGVVYKARQKSLNRIVAIKTLPPANQNRRTFAERFKREAEALASLNHPNIVGIYDFGETPSGTLYYVMEFVKGSNLRRMMKVGALSTQHMLSIVTQVCAALQHAHDHGVVHRDIKPGNILIDDEGIAKVADFGLAKVLGPQHTAGDLTSALDTLGTPDYSAPEVLTGDKEVDHRADIYSLGVMLYEMSTGRVPKGAWEAPSRCGADLRLDEMVSRALQVDPESRYQRVNDLTQELQEMLKQSGPPVPDRVRTVAKTTTPVNERSRKNPDAVIVPFPSQAARPLVRWMRLLLLVFLILGGVGITLWQSPAAREWAGIKEKSPPTPMPTTSQVSPTKAPKATMQDQRALARWVFSRGGLINVATAFQKADQGGDEDGLHSEDTLPKGEFTIWRVSFSGDERFTDEDLSRFLSTAEKTQTVTNLSLHGTSVTSLGIASLPTLKNTLTNLDIRQTSALSAKSVESIAACDRLKMLFVTDTTPDHALVEKLRSLLPDCEIFPEKSDLAD